MPHLLLWRHQVPVGKFFLYLSIPPRRVPTYEATIQTVCHDPPQTSMLESSWIENGGQSMEAAGR